MADNIKILISVIRTAALKKDDQLANLLRELSEATRRELLAVLPDEEPERKFECPVCRKRFRRKWNCDRHARKHESGGKRECLFKDCDEQFPTKSQLREHEKEGHGLDRQASKRAKVGVRHGDHYDLLLPSGALLHMGEQGLEQRRLEEKKMGAAAPT